VSDIFRGNAHLNPCWFSKVPSHAGESANSGRPNDAHGKEIAEFAGKLRLPGALESGVSLPTPED